MLYQTLIVYGDILYLGCITCNSAIISYCSEKNVSNFNVSYGKKGRWLEQQRTCLVDLKQ